MQIVITRDSSSFYGKGNAESLPHELVSSLASTTLAGEIVRLFNLVDGSRILDCFTAFRQVCKAFGSTFAFVFGFASDDFKRKIAEVSAGKLRAFLFHDRGTGVMLYDREVDGLFPVEINAPSVQDCFGRSLLIPTGEVSLAHNVPVFLRVDVVEPTNARALLEVEHIMFADKLGNSLAGLADIPEPVVGVQDADKAFKAVLGSNYEVLGVNALLFHAWSMACNEEFFDVDLTGFQSPEYDESRDVICHFRCQGGWWHLTFSIFGNEYGLGQVVDDKTVLSASWSETKRSLEALLQKLKTVTPDQVIQSLDFDHILDEVQLLRFSPGFYALLQNDPGAAGECLFEGVSEALEKMNGNDNFCLPFFYNGGMERIPKYAGESFTAVPSLQIPLYLVEADRERRIPTTYLVAYLGMQADGTTTCEFPTVLDAMTATLNHKHFRRAFRRNWGEAA